VIKYGPWFPDHPSTDEVYAAMELRHFWRLGLDYMLFDKICGDSEERDTYRKARVAIALRPFQLDSKQSQIKIKSKQETNLHQFLYNKT